MHNIYEIEKINDDEEKNEQMNRKINNSVFRYNKHILLALIKIYCGIHAFFLLFGIMWIMWTVYSGYLGTTY